MTSRLNLALSNETRARLERLRVESGAPSATATITRALRVCEWLRGELRRVDEFDPPRAP